MSFLDRFPPSCNTRHLVAWSPGLIWLYTDTHTFSLRIFSFILYPPSQFQKKAINIFNFLVIIMSPLLLIIHIIFQLRRQ